MKRPVINPKTPSTGRRPWIPIYVDDHLAETTALTSIEHSAYILLLFTYWRNGALPTDRATLARVSRLTPKEWAKAERALAPLFGPNWTHAGLDGQIQHAADVSEKRRGARAQRQDWRPTIVGSIEGTNDRTFDDRLQTTDFKQGAYPGVEPLVEGNLRRGRAEAETEFAHDDEDVFGSRGAA